MKNVNVITPLPWKEAIRGLLNETVKEVRIDLDNGIELSRIGPHWGIRWTRKPSSPCPVETVSLRGVTVQMRRHSGALSQALEGLLRGSHRRVSLMWGPTRQYAGVALELVVLDDELYASISV